MNKYPLINFTAIFICGIILRKYINIEPVYIIIFTAFALTAAIVVHGYFRNKFSNIYASILIYVSILSLGQLDLSLNKSAGNILPKNIFYTNVRLWGELKNINLIKNNGFDFIVGADSISLNKKLIKTNIRLLCRYFGDSKKNAYSLYNKISIGNRVMLKGRLTGIKKAGNPGEYDYSPVLTDRGISGIINFYRTSDIKIISDKKVGPDYLFKFRKIIDNKLIELHSTQSAALLRGLLLADRSIIDIELKDSFINAGVVHLLAVSGLHVGYIVLIIFVLTGRLNLYLRSIITIMGLIVFTFITGMPSSVVRASIMSAILVIAFLSGRSTNLFNSLSFAALIILIFNPSELFAPGFQLSFSAVLSIGVFYPYLKKISLAIAKKNGLLKGFLLFISVSLAAQIGTTPIIIYYFGKISLVGVFANLIAIPAVGIIVGIGIITLITGFIIPSIAVYFAIANDVLILMFNWFVGFAGQLEYSHLVIRNFSFVDIFIFYCFLILLMVAIRKFIHLSAKIVLFVLVIFNVIIFCSVDDRKLLVDKKFNLLMIDVGQGDSFLIKFPNGKTALIDAGMTTQYFDNGEQRILPLMQQLKINAIDYAFVSHVDADHYSGFVSLVHFGMIKNLYKPHLDSLNEKDLRFEKFLRKLNIPIRYYDTEIKKIGNTRLYIMNAGLAGVNYKNSTNDKSGFIKIVFGKTSFLFTGDLEKTAEIFYSLKYGKFLKSDVLKVSHHGSNGATSDVFLKQVKPRICLISAGIGNKFGHPTEETLKRIAETGARIFRTDIAGAALLQSDGGKISFINWR